MAVTVWPHPVRGKGANLAGVPDFEVDRAWKQKVCVGQIQKYLARLVAFLREKGIARVALGLKVDGEPGLRRSGICVIHVEPPYELSYHARSLCQAVHEEFVRCDYGDCQQPGKNRPKLERWLCNMHTRILVRRVPDPEGRPSTGRGEYQGGGFDTNPRRH